MPQRLQTRVHYEVDSATIGQIAVLPLQQMNPMTTAIATGPTNKAVSFDPRKSPYETPASATRGADQLVLPFSLLVTEVTEK